MKRSITAIACGGVAWLVSRYALGWDSDSSDLIFLASVLGLMLSRLDRLEAAHDKGKAKGKAKEKSA